MIKSLKFLIVSILLDFGTRQSLLLEDNITFCLQFQLYLPRSVVPVDFVKRI
eukprot:COSAG02_NODE_41021_length_399_cov_0.670000_1_plen_51_part_01